MYHTGLAQDGSLQSAIKCFLHGHIKTRAVGGRTLGSWLVTVGHQLWVFRLCIIPEGCWEGSEVLLSKQRIHPSQSHPRSTRRASGGGAELLSRLGKGWTAPSPYSMMPCWSWSAASAAVGNRGAKMERGRKGGNSMRNHEKCGAWKCLLRFMAARPSFQEKHIFKFNLRCLFFSLHPLPTVGKGLALKAVPRCLETATMLKKHSIMWLFWKCGDSSCKRGSAFSAGEHVLYVCSCRTGLGKKKPSWRYFYQSWKQSVTVCSIKICRLFCRYISFICHISGCLVAFFCIKLCAFISEGKLMR